MRVWVTEMEKFGEDRIRAVICVESNSGLCVVWAGVVSENKISPSASHVARL